MSALSLGADADPDVRHLARLAALCERFEPALVSEHLAWSAWRGVYHPDLLPFPRTGEALDAASSRNVGRTQDALGRSIAIENPSHYLRFDGHEYDEIDFLVELARRTGCGLLLDVNNVHVSARNLGFDAAAVIDAFPGELVREIHLAGHSADPALGDALLIDSHDAPVAPAVWALYERLIARIGPRPTLIERDDNIPEFAELLAERERAQRRAALADGRGMSRLRRQCASMAMPARRLPGRVRAGAVRAVPTRIARPTRRRSLTRSPDSPPSRDSPSTATRC